MERSGGVKRTKEKERTVQKERKIWVISQKEGNLDQRGHWEKEKEGGV